MEKTIVKLRKSGNSLVITIPKRILEILPWNEKDYVTLKIEDKSLLVEKVL